MKNGQNKISILNPVILLLSFFGVGFIPFAPGTFGSLIPLPLLYLIGQYNLHPLLIISAILLLTLIFSFICDYAQSKYKLHDPQWIVIDEVLGMATAWSFLLKQNWIHYLLVFILFRLFDIFKVWPSSFFDKKIKHGAGVILDDIICGVFAGITYRLLLLIF